MNHVVQHQVLDRVFASLADTDAERKIWFAILDEKPGLVEIGVDRRVGGRQTAVWGPDPDPLFRETRRAAADV